MKEILLSSAMFPMYATILGIILGVLANYVFDNHYNKPKVRAIVYQVIENIEKSTVEGTPVNKFLDIFLTQFRLENHRDPNAGELKTAFDIANKKLSIEYNRPF